MSLVRAFLQTISGASNVILPVRAWGANSVVIYDQGNVDGLTTINVEDSGPANQMLACFYTCGPVQGGAAVQYGFPLSYDNLRITTTGAGAHIYRVELYSQIIRPFGAIPLATTEVTPAASSTATILTRQNLGMVRAISGNYTTNKAAQIRYSVRVGGKTISTVDWGDQTAATGGSAGLIRVSVVGEMGVDVINNDGAAAADIIVNLVGHLDFGGFNG